MSTHLPRTETKSLTSHISRTSRRQPSHRSNIMRLAIVIPGRYFHKRKRVSVRDELLPARAILKVVAAEVSVVDRWLDLNEMRYRERID